MNAKKWNKTQHLYNAAYRWHRLIANEAIAWHEYQGIETIYVMHGHAVIWENARLSCVASQVPATGWRNGARYRWYWYRRYDIPF